MNFSGTNKLEIRTFTQETDKVNSFKTHKDIQVVLFLDLYLKVTDQDGLFKVIFKGKNTSDDSTQESKNIVTHVGCIKDGMYHGKYREYYNNKVSMSVTYLNGLFQGSYLAYNEKGDLESMTNCDRGVIHGLASVYKNGIQTSMTNYTNGVQNGPAYIYENGKIKETTIFSEGIKIPDLDLSGDSVLKVVDKMFSKFGMPAKNRIRNGENFELLTDGNSESSTSSNIVEITERKTKARTRPVFGEKKARTRPIFRE